MKKARWMVLVMFLAMVGLGAPLAQAATVDYYFNYTFSNSTVPDSAAPWLIASFTDTMGGTTLTLTSSLDYVAGGGNNEFFSQVYFNYEGTLAAAPASNFTLLSGALTAPTVAYDSNDFKADGDGWFDILLSFATTDGDPTRFGDQDSFSLFFSGASATNFYGFSAPGGGSGPFLAAAHLQGISTGDGSTWIRPGDTPVIPEPSTVVLLGAGLVGLVLVARKRRSDS